MKYLIFIIGLFILGNVSAQELSKKEKRKLEKEQEEKEWQKKYLSTVSFVEGRRFVLEAEYLQGKYGSRVPVNSSINFVYIDSSEIVIQIGNGVSYGYNGVGGFTIEGSVTKWELKKYDKKKSLYLDVNVMSSAGLYSVSMDIRAGMQTNAVITSITSGRLEYIGKIVPIDKAKIYKARPTY
jgi:hypothetical protein